MKNSAYINQVNLLLDCLPALKNQTDFALKGGTAINFFVQNLPRLSVDIDLTYLKVTQRKQALHEIEQCLVTMGKAITSRNQRVLVKEQRTREGLLHKLIVSNKLVKIKIEPNFILRGTLLPTVKMDLVKAVEEKFEYNISSIPVVALAELYAGKICAALGRQHPRDLFDIQTLLNKIGLTDEIRHAFAVYLVCSPRPIHELLQPNTINLKHIYENEFVNMTEADISLESLLNTRETLIKSIQQSLSPKEKQFILSVKQAKPDYSLMSFNNLQAFPALQWKLFNIKRMNKNKHLKMLNKLESILSS